MGNDAAANNISSILQHLFFSLLLSQFCNSIIILLGKKKKSGKLTYIKMNTPLTSLTLSERKEIFFNCRLGFMKIVNDLPQNLYYPFLFFI